MKAHENEHSGNLTLPTNVHGFWKEYKILGSELAQTMLSPQEHGLAGLIWCDGLTPAPALPHLLTKGTSMWSFPSSPACLCKLQSFLPPNDLPSEIGTFHNHTVWCLCFPLHWAHSRSALSFKISSCCTIVHAYWFKQLSISQPPSLLSTHFLQIN